MKERKPRKFDDGLVPYLCRTQGIGMNLAEDIVAKMKPEIRSNVEAMVKDGKPVNEVMAALKPAPDPQPEKPEPKKTKQPKTPTE